MAMDKDGSFSFEYVPGDNYILQVSDAEDAAEDGGGSEPGDAGSKHGTPPVGRRYLTKEIPIRVQSDMNDIDVPLTDQPAAKPQ
jgi:hypothetical protein